MISEIPQLVRTRLNIDIGKTFDNDFKQLINFTNEHLTSFPDEQSIKYILQKFNFGNLVDKDPLLYRVFSLAILKKFLEMNSLDYDFIRRKVIVEELKGYERDHSVSWSLGGGLNAGVAGASKGTVYETNINIPPTFEKIVVTGNSEIDNYIKYSIIFYYNCEDFSQMTKFQRVSLFQLGQYLSKKSLYISQLMKGMVGSRFRRSNQFILGDYLENFIRFNQTKADEFSKYKIIPFMIELNGEPGVGKSTFVDFLRSMIHQIFPFYEEQDATYNRVNDRFWNGYKQQPVVLYDDQNQNNELRYNLDNEIIQLGSGQFVYPPMAFEKSTKFSSLFVVFTTNKRIIQTTKVNKGAISRRIKTYKCEPLIETGEYVDDISGKKWVYHENVEYHPFNVNYSNSPFIHVLFDFFSFMMKQRSLNFERKSPFYYLNSFNNKPIVTLDQLFKEKKEDEVVSVALVEVKEKIYEPREIVTNIIDNISYEIKDKPHFKIFNEEDKSCGKYFVGTFSAKYLKRNQDIVNCYKFINSKYPSTEYSYSNSIRAVFNSEKIIVAFDIDSIHTIIMFKNADSFGYLCFNDMELDFYIIHSLTSLSDNVYITRTGYKFSWEPYISVISERFLLLLKHRVSPLFHYSDNCIVQHGKHMEYSQVKNVLDSGYSKDFHLYFSTFSFKFEVIEIPF